MIGSGFPDGDEPSDPVFQSACDRLAMFAEQRHAKFVKLARLWLSRFHLDTIGLAPEGAVHNAWLVLLERSKEGGLPPIHTLDEFEKIFTLLLRNVILDERRRQKALKRARGPLGTRPSMWSPPMPLVRTSM